MSDPDRIPKIMHGPYGSAWAFRVEHPAFSMGFGWHRADNEEAAMEAARKDLSKFGGDPDKAVIDRVDPPLYEPKTGARDNDEQGYATDGAYSGDGVHVGFSGACPVQGDGELDGMDVYYRARGNGWSLDVTLSDTEVWTYGEGKYAWPDGGWIHRDESAANIEKAVAAFRARHSQGSEAK